VLIQEAKQDDVTREKYDIVLAKPQHIYSLDGTVVGTNVFRPKGVTIGTAAKVVSGGVARPFRSTENLFYTLCMQKLLPRMAASVGKQERNLSGFVDRSKCGWVSHKVKLRHILLPLGSAASIAARASLLLEIVSIGKTSTSGSCTATICSYSCFRVAKDRSSVV